MGHAIVRFVAFLCLSILRLRYRITVKGLKQLKREDVRKGILFLPNHPAEVDPIILTLLLLGTHRIRPLVIENFFQMRGAKLIMKIVRAMPIPDFSQSANVWQKDVLKKLQDKMQAAIQNGDNFLIYPSGFLKVEGHEVVGGSSFVYKLLDETPHINAVLVRTTGLWGSSFSKAITGTTPPFWHRFFEGVVTVLKNGIFFTPRRNVLIELEKAPEDLPIHQSRLEFNRYLEKWYNQYPLEDGSRSDEEPLKLVSRSFWNAKDVPQIEKREVFKAEKLEIQIPDDLREAVIRKLAELSGHPMEMIEDQKHLFKDLGLDSLDIATMQAFLSERGPIPNIPPHRLQFVQDLYLLALGKLEEEETSDIPTPKRHLSERDKSRPIGSIPDGKTIHEVFLKTCEHFGKHLALADRMTEPLTYKRLKLGALILSAKIKDLPGANIGILLPASVGTYVTVFATLLAGKTPLMLNWTTGMRSLNYAKKIGHLETVLSSKKFLARLPDLEIGELQQHLILLEDIRAHVGLWDKLKGLYLSKKSPESLLKKLRLDHIDESECGVLLFTSGTETLPKAVPLSHKNLLENQRAALSQITLKPDDILYGVLPPFHSFGFSVTGLMPILVGLKVFFSPDPTDSRAIAKDVKSEGITILCLAPSFYRNLFAVAQKEAFDTVRLFVTGAERAPEELFDYVEKLPHEATFLEGYGITECSPIVTLGGIDGKHIGVGPAIPGVDLMTIHPESLEPQPKGEMGEICIAGPNVFSGYLGEFKRDPFFEIEGKRWYRSGDLGHIDESGNLILGGRSSRFIKIGGEMVSLVAVEEELIKSAHEKNWGEPKDDQPLFALCAKGKLGDQPKLILISTIDISREIVNQAVKEKGFSNIVKIAEVQKKEEIPLTGTGKIHYRILEEELDNVT